MRISISQRLFVLSSVSALMLAACGKGNNPNSTVPMATVPRPQLSSLQRPQAPFTQAPGTVLGAAPTQTTLAGNWTSVCLPDNSSTTDTKTFVREQYVFSPDQSFSHTHATYGDSNCATQALHSDTATGTFQQGNHVQARFANAELTTFHFTGTRGDAIALELVINSPLEEAGKWYSLYRIDMGTLFMGVLPYSDEPEDRGGAHVPALDMQKEFKLQ